MKTIAHLSDLHFGREEPAVADALAAELAANPPSLVVVSGDLTQRARRRQFMAARDFLARLPSPQLVVPGNHDVPLFDVLRRFLSPLGRYRRYITARLDPVVRDAGWIVAGVNSARAFTWKSGRISLRQIDSLQRTLGGADVPFKVVVTHHPFIPPPGEAGMGIAMVGRAARALAVLDAANVDLILAGHLHQGYSGDTRRQYPGSRRTLVSVQAGTALSNRLREQANAYNRITLRDDRIEIEVRAWQAGGFVGTRTERYARHHGSWAPVPSLD